MITLHTFDLCKQLHELKPHWQPIGAYVIKSEGDEPQLFDYGMLTLSTRQGALRNGWIASYDNDAGYPIGDIFGVAETALDAVLELTIEMAKRTEI